MEKGEKPLFFGRPEKAYKQDVAHALADVLSESRTMTGVVGVMFGFLLNASIMAKNLTATENWLLTVALISSLLAVGIFSLPVIYHHLKYPYENKEKFIERGHYFIKWGFFPASLSFFASTVLALHHFLGFYAFAVGVAAFVVLILVYYFRKHDLQDMEKEVAAVTSIPIKEGKTLILSMEKQGKKKRRKK